MPDENGLNQNQGGQKYRWAILAFMCLCIFAPNYTQYVFSPLGVSFMESIAIAPERQSAALSSIMMGPLVSGIFYSLPSGVLVDRFGVKRVLMASAFVSAFGAALRIWAEDYATMVVSMVLLGMVGTFVTANGPKVFGLWFPREQVGRMFGVMLAASSVAMAVGSGTGALFSGYRAAFVFSAAIVVAMAALWAIFGRDARGASSSGGASVEEGEKSPPVAECLRTIVRCSKIWPISACIMLMCAAGVSLGIFIPTAMIQTRGFTDVEAGALGMASTVGAMFGSLAIPQIVHKISKKRMFLCVCGLLASIGVAFAWNAPEGPLLVIGLGAGGFFSMGVTPILMSMPITLPEIGTRYAGTAGGVTATIQLAGTAAIPTLIFAPIAGTDYGQLFLMLGSLPIIFIFLLFLLPIAKK